MHRSLMGKTHRHYVPSQRRNHQWTMVINNLNDNNDDEEVKPVNCRRRPSVSTCSGAGGGGSAAHTKDQMTSTLGRGPDDGDWTAAGRRLLLSADDATTTSSVCYATSRPTINQSINLYLNQTTQQETHSEHTPPTDIHIHKRKKPCALPIVL